MEVLVSLAVAGLLIAVACVSLIHVLRTEARARDMREAGFHLQTVACCVYLGRDRPEQIAPRLAPHWRAGMEQVVAGHAGNRTPWVIWSLRSTGKSALPYDIALRAGLGPWHAARRE